MKTMTMVMIATTMKIMMVVVEVVIITMLQQYC